MGHFKLKKKTLLSDLKETDVIEESDFATLTPDGYFVQLKYYESEEQDLKKFEVKPGFWMIQKTVEGMGLIPVELTNDSILKQFVNTKMITERVEKFFAKLHVFARFGIEVPKRGILLYGPPGTGKSTAINEVSRIYGADGKTAVIMWPTDKYEAYQVKDFFRTFKYVGVERLILVVEDIGGSEMSGVKRQSDSSLLALLDNNEKVFTIPLMIIATTNFADSLMENLTNRKGRFDDVMEIGHPSPEQRVALMQFFGKDENITDDALRLLEGKDCSKFSAAHIREVLLRAAIYDLTHAQVIKELVAEIKNYEAEFQKRKKIGMGED